MTAPLSESECKGRDFSDSGKMFGRFFLLSPCFDMVSDRFLGIQNEK